jgi:hypothetical protein
MSNIPAKRSGKERIMNWIRTHDGPGPEYIEELDGIHWTDAPLPPRWHRCKPQTRGYATGEFVQRCACGAVWILGGWTNRNERRKGKRFVIKALDFLSDNSNVTSVAVPKHLDPPSSRSPE